MDISKLPVLEAVIGFFLLVMAVGFYGAFAAVNDDESGTAASGTPSSTSSVPVSDQVAVSLRDNSFDPKAITVPAGKPITFSITNNGKVPHNMHIAGADNQFDTDDDAVTNPLAVAPGKQAKLVWDSKDASGKIDFRCDFHSAEMTGTIAVQ